MLGVVTGGEAGSSLCSEWKKEERVRVANAKAMVEATIDSKDKGNDQYGGSSLRSE